MPTERPSGSWRWRQNARQPAVVLRSTTSTREGSEHPSHQTHKTCNAPRDGLKAVKDDLEDEGPGVLLALLPRLLLPLLGAHWGRLRAPATRVGSWRTGRN